MAFIKNQSIQVGDTVETTVMHESLSGYFEIGTTVTVIGISDRGYDIQDEYGHQIIEVGWTI